MRRSTFITYAKEQQPPSHPQQCVCVCVYISLRMAVSVCVCVALARELKVACLGLYMSAIILSYVA